jgi:riboflavin kinase/FMN adenylyltransferase
MTPGIPRRFSGQVIHGEGRGRKLGFPTANIAPDGERARDLPRGVFAAQVAWAENSELRALANIGTRPTFAEGALSVELHILDFSGDLYGQRLEVTLLKKLRDERSFSKPTELVEQIHRDIHQARVLFNREIGPGKNNTTEVEGVDND